MKHISSGHKDLILAIAYNLYGNRLATAGADHLLKVWQQDDTTQDWRLIDTWLAHDAEVTDVKWTPPYLGEHVGSIGEDGTFKLWREDVNQPPNSGRRFVKVFSMITATSVPYMSLDFKSIGNELFLAIITRHGHLTVCEPENTNLTTWKTMWSDYRVRTPSRTEETGFRLSWHKEKLPAWPAIYAGLDRKSLSIAVAVGDTVRIFRTDKDRKFYSACQLDGARDLVRDVDWANGSMRGFDVIATASKDGYVRIYELHTLPTTVLSQDNSRASTPAIRPIRSGIGAGLAGGARGKKDEVNGVPGAVKQEARLVAELDTPTSTPWRVTWSFAGDALVSTGDDGTVRMWKKSVEGKWLEAIEIDAVSE